VCGRLNLELFKARDVMHRPVITITPRESLSHLARLLLETSHGGFPVVKYYEKTRHEVAYGLLTRYVLARRPFARSLSEIVSEYFIMYLQDAPLA